MNYFSNLVYFLAFRRSAHKDGIKLAFVPEIAEDDEPNWPNMGLFVFPRHESNRGRARELHFPAIIGFDDNAMEINVTLRSMYPQPGGSNRFTCLPDANFPFLEKLNFVARNLPTPVELVGSATIFSTYNLWELVPEDRFLLEELWRQTRFYFVGSGKPPIDINFER